MYYQHRNGVGIWIFVVLVVVVVIGVFVYASNSMYEAKALVTATTWRRVLSVEMFKTLSEDTLVRDMPSDAFNVYRYDDTYYDYETCYTTDADGNLSSYECGDWVTDHRAKFNVNRWIWDHDLVTTGTLTDERVWPVFEPSPNLFIGAQRESGRREVFNVRFKRQDNSMIADYTPPTFISWSGFIPGQVYGVKINRLERIQWDTLTLVDAR